MAEKGIRVSISNAWSYLRKVRFHKLDKKRWDRKGPIVTFYFEEFPNREWHQAMCTFCVRALTALINASHTLVDIENYSWPEMNHCWVYYGTCRNEEIEECRTNKWIPVRVDHKYWSDREVDAFKKIIRTIAELYQAEITGYA